MPVQMKTFKFLNNLVATDLERKGLHYKTNFMVLTATVARRKCGWGQGVKAWFCHSAGGPPQRWPTSSFMGAIG